MVRTDLIDNDMRRRIDKFDEESEKRFDDTKKLTTSGMIYILMSWMKLMKRHICMGPITHVMNLMRT